MRIVFAIFVVEVAQVLLFYYLGFLHGNHYAMGVCS
jgi:hypothetical protein